MQPCVCVSCVAATVCTTVTVPVCVCVCVCARVCDLTCICGLEGEVEGGRRGWAGPPPQALQPVHFVRAARASSGPVLSLSSSACSTPSSLLPGDASRRLVRSFKRLQRPHALCAPGEAKRRGCVCVCVWGGGGGGGGQAEGLSCGPFGTPGLRGSSEARASDPHIHTLKRRRPGFQGGRRGGRGGGTHASL